MAMAKARADLDISLHTMAGSVAEAQEATEGVPTPTDLTIPGSPLESAQFADIVAQNDPAGVLTGQAAQATFEDRVNTQADLRQQISDVGRDRAVLSTLGSARSARMEEQRQADIALDLKKDEERRSLANQAALPTVKVEHMSDRIVDLQELHARTNDPRKQLKIERKIGRLIAAEFNNATANLPGEAVLNMAVFQNDLALYQNQSQIVNSYTRLLEVAERDPNFAGFRGTWADFGNFLFETVDDIEAMIMGDVMTHMNDPLVDDETKRILRDRFLIRRDPQTGLERSRADLASNAAKFVILRAQNPGRMNSEQIRELDKMTNVTSGTSADAVRRMQATLEVLGEQRKNTQTRLRIMGRAMGIDFDEVGNVVLGDQRFDTSTPFVPGVTAQDLPRQRGESVLPPLEQGAPAAGPPPNAATPVTQSDRERVRANIRARKAAEQAVGR
jgi:hypothetical protein